MTIKKKIKQTVITAAEMSLEEFLNYAKVVEI